MRSPGLIKDLIGVIIVMRFRHGEGEGGETRNSERGIARTILDGSISISRSEDGN